MQLKKKDMKLIFELSRNPRESVSRLGKKAGMSQQLASYKLKSYQESGLLKGVYPVVDYSRLGFLNFRVLFKTSYINRQSFGRLVESLKGNESVTEITEIGGSHDLLLGFTTQNPSSFNKTMRSLLDSSHDLKDHTILTTVVMHLFPRKYILGLKSSSEDVVVGGDRSTSDLDEHSRDLLAHLQSNGFCNSVQLSRLSGVNPKTVLSRTRKLQESKVLRGFRPLLDIRKLGYRQNKIFFSYHHLTPEREDAFRAFCMTNPNITEMVKLFGQWDVELTVETKTGEEFRNAYSLLREQFQDIIKDIDNFPVFQMHKKQYLPDRL